MNQSDIDEIKKKSRIDVATFSKRDQMLKRYRDMYFMDNLEKPKRPDEDPADIKLTPSPSSRNRVIGMHRLIKTSVINVGIEDADKGAADQIEKGLKSILRVSGENRRATVESDLALAAVLFGSAVAYTESIDDLLSVKTLKPYRRQHLEKQRNRSPFLIRTITPQESYPTWDDDMLISHTWRYKLTGSQIKNRWGMEDARDNTVYWINDVFTPDHHVVWAEGITKDIMAAEHGLGCLPIFVAYSGGSELFGGTEEAQQSFLYAIAKGDLDKRENGLLTTFFTNIHQRGAAGPLISIDPESTRQDQTVMVSYAGGMRYIIAKATQIDDKIIDPVIFEAKAMLDELSGQSTIYSQTLGESIGGNVPFSSLAMLSNSGKLPLVDPQKAIEHVLTQAFNHILYRIKNDPIENDLIAPEEIEDDIRVTVSLAAKLPQDSLRNAQVAANLGPLVSDKWKREEVLQIDDSDEMDRQIMKETIMKMLQQNMITDPNTIAQLMQTVMGIKPPAPAQAPAPSGPGPEGMPGEMPGGMPGGQGQPTPEQMQAMMQAGQGSMSGMGNMEAMPMTDSMVPPEERGMP